MSSFLITALFAAMFFGIAMQDPPAGRFTLTEIIHDYDVAKNESTLRVPEAQLAAPKDRYHSLSSTTLSPAMCRHRQPT